MRLRSHFGTVLSLLALATLSDSSQAPPLPNPLHCLSRLSFENESLNSSDHLRIDEYVDLEARHSSISIYNAREDSTEIHYKKFSSSGLADRMTIRYKPAEMSCNQQQIGYLQISELRRVALNLYKPDEMAEKLFDVPIGPSLLLLAIQTNMNQFKYVMTVEGDAPGSIQSNVYRCQIASNPSNSIFRHLSVVLHVSSRGQKRGLTPDDSLGTALVEGAQLEVKFLCAYHMAANRRPPANPPPGHEAMEKGQDGGLNEKALCLAGDQGEGNELIFKIHFEVVEFFQAGSLIGRELDELEREHFQFAREPFLQPVGIGCWTLGANQNWRNNLIEESVGGVSFSASYVTSAGLKGVSYVAYDGASSMLRIEREGRKSVYDIGQGTSYHVAEFSDSSGLGENLLAIELASEKCIVLEMSDLIRQDKNIMVQLLGLGSTDAHYLGPRTIEHEQYKVYEMSFNEPQAVPLLLQTRLKRAEKEFGVTYFITYYVQADRRLRFIELYSFEAPLKDRKLINRLEFVEFSWALDVEPLDDTESGDSSESSLRLFQVDACHHSRATQSSLVVALDNDNTEAGSEQLDRGLHFHQQELAAAIQRMLATSLRLSVMNLVDFKLSFDLLGRHGRVLASGRVVDLKAGISQLINLGATYVIDDGHTLAANPDRFSLEGCMLDSLEYPKANKFAFCPQRAECLILPADYENAELLDEKFPSKRDMCHLYRLRYSTSDTSAGRAAYMAEVNQRGLDGKQFEFHVSAYDLNDHEQTPFLFRAKAELKELVRLDPIGAQLSSTGSGSDKTRRLGLVSGLHYMTMDEEKGGHNCNVRVALSNELVKGQDKSKLLAHCQVSCQMYEFCGSFSVCLKSGTNSQTSPECVLSTVRLTGELVGRFLEAANQTSFQAIASSELSSQTLVMHRNDDCSLHPRDFVSDYKLIRSVETVHNKPAATSLDSVRALPAMSFADCAGLSFEKTFGVESVGKTNFTYCQLDSLCLVRGDSNVELQRELADGPCRDFERDPVRFYASLRATHMRVAAVAATHSPDETLIGSMTGQGAGTGGQSPRLVTSFWGVSEADCARDCSLHKSGCLAFDSCRNEGKILCILYAVRSPLSPRGAYSPLLERERKLPADSVTLFGSRICDHFYLEPAYFKVRLQNLLARSEADGFEFFPDELRKLEDELEATNERISGEALLAVTDPGAIVEDHERERPREEPSEPPVALVHGAELTIGLVAGCILAAYKQQVGQLISGVYARASV